MAESPATICLRKLLTQFPNAATKTLARTAYAASPEYWKDLEACRNNVRRIRGEYGAKERRETTDKSQYNPPKITGFDSLPEPWKEMPFDAFQINGPARVLVLSDIHIPFHDKTALIAALERGKRDACDVVLLNGDILDCYAESFWEKDPKLRDFPSELKAVREFLGTLRSNFKKARIIYKPGNHEERHTRYMRLKAPELLGVPEFDFGNIVHAVDYGVELTSEMVMVKVGRLPVLHGHEYRFAISNPVNPARGLFLRAKTHAVCGHMHQSSQHSEKNLEDNVVSCWSTGCLCNMHPAYRPYNGWNHGFAIVDIDKNGVFEVNNHRIIHGKVY